MSVRALTRRPPPPNASSALLGGRLLGRSLCRLRWRHPGGPRAASTAGARRRGTRRPDPLAELGRLPWSHHGVLERLERCDACLLGRFDADGLAGRGIPRHSGRSLDLANFANPGMATGSPLATTAVTTSVKPVRTLATCFGSRPVWAATAATAAISSRRSFSISSGFRVDCQYHPCVLRRRGRTVPAPVLTVNGLPSSTNRHPEGAGTASPFDWRPAHEARSAVGPDCHRGVPESVPTGEVGHVATRSDGGRRR